MSLCVASMLVCVVHAEHVHTWFQTIAVVLACCCVSLPLI